ncbi:unnamed protein product [Arctogadus glacialis]
MALVTLSLWVLSTLTCASLLPVTANRHAVHWNSSNIQVPAGLTVDCDACFCLYVGASQGVAPSFFSKSLLPLTRRHTFPTAGLQTPPLLVLYESPY